MQGLVIQIFIINYVRNYLFNNKLTIQCIKNKTIASNTESRSNIKSKFKLIELIP